MVIFILKALSLWYNKYYGKPSAYVHIPFVHRFVIIVTFQKYLSRINQWCHLEHLLRSSILMISQSCELYIMDANSSVRSIWVALDGLTQKSRLICLEELTIEANPGDLDADKIAVLKQSPVNRGFLRCADFWWQNAEKIGRSHLRRIFMRISTVSNWLVLTISPLI